jgi:uncharacterized protein (TIGR03437 family)
VVAPQTLSVNPASLNFTYTTGQAVPVAQTFTVTASGGGALINAQLQGSPAPAWLQVSPASANAPGTFTVTVSPASLAAGSYTANIAISSGSALTPLTVQVNLTVRQIPKPVIASIVNAGSYISSSVAPGENIVIFGTGLGPDTLVGGTVANGAYTTTAGNTRVLFDGVPAPVYYASALQTSVWVPYGVNGRSTTTIVVEYSGVQSTAATYNVAGAAPGIYTQNQQGNGPGAILNQDGVTLNSPAAPAPRGNVVAIYMTGEGETSPKGADGAIIPAVPSALKTPVLPVTATIGGIPANVVYKGSAPGYVSGLMQVNIEIPATAPTGGAVPLVVTVGTATTQPNVTIAVQ